jgi:hypothetical protein
VIAIEARRSTQDVAATRHAPHTRPEERAGCQMLSGVWERRSTLSSHTFVVAGLVDRPLGLGFLPAASDDGAIRVSARFA